MSTKRRFDDDDDDEGDDDAGRYNDDHDDDDGNNDDASASESEGDDEALIPFDQRLSARKSADEAKRKAKKKAALPARPQDAATRKQNELLLRQSWKKRRLTGDKNAPVEMSAKVRVGRMGATVANTSSKREFRDPRFDDRCGVLARDVASGSYYFVAEIEQREVDGLRAALERAAAQSDDDPHFVDDDQVARMQAQLDDILKRRKERERNLRVANQHRQLLAQEQELVAQGKRPFHHKKTALRQSVLRAEFKDLKAAGAVKKTILNRAKRSTAHARKSLPRRRMDE